MTKQTTIKEEGENLVIKTTHSFDGVAKMMDNVRSEGIIGMNGDKSTMGETRLIGCIPTPLITAWLKEAGVAWDDPAASDVIKRHILAGDVDKFRSDWRKRW